jgi:hypothetical protein
VIAMSEKRVFISHSSEDKELAFLFKDYILEGIFHFQDIFCSSDGCIYCGEEWLPFIHKKLDESEFVVFIVTENFKNSYFCMNELGAAWLTKKRMLILTVEPATKSNSGEIIKAKQTHELLNKDHYKHILFDIGNLIGKKFSMEEERKLNNSIEDFIGKAARIVDENPFTKEGGYVGSYETTLNVDFLKTVKRYIKQAKTIKMVGICLAFFDDKENLFELVNRTKRDDNVEVVLCFGDPYSSSVISRKLTQYKEKFNQHGHDPINTDYLTRLYKYIKKHKGNTDKTKPQDNY